MAKRVRQRQPEESLVPRLVIQPWGQQPLCSPPRKSRSFATRCSRKERRGNQQLNERGEPYGDLTGKLRLDPGKLDELKSIYEQALEAMKHNEPDARAAHCYVSEKDNALYVRDEFKDAAALACTRAAPRPAISHSCLCVFVKVTARRNLRAPSPGVWRPPKQCPRAPVTPGFGRRSAVLPATCRSGLRRLASL